MEFHYMNGIEFSPHSVGNSGCMARISRLHESPRDLGSSIQQQIFSSSCPMNQHYVVVENFFDQAEAMRTAFEQHFSNPQSHGVAQQIWNYW